MAKTKSSEKKNLKSYLQQKNKKKVEKCVLVSIFYELKHCANLMKRESLEKGISFLMKRLTKAEKNPNYIEKKKEAGKYDEVKKKRATAMRELRKKRKDEEKNMSPTELEKILENRRKNNNERLRKHRLNKKKSGKAVDAGEKKSSVKNVKSGSYKVRQTLSKAVKKATNALPLSPKKKLAVLTNMVEKLDDKDKADLVKVVTNSEDKTNDGLSPLDMDIRDFFQRDDISRVSPKTRDVKTYFCPISGGEVQLPLRHMVLSMKEAFAIFLEERKRDGKDLCGFSMFYYKRPEHIRLINDLPHDTCLCAYHANFMEAVAALHKAVPNIPKYESGFVRRLICENSSDDCWLGSCKICSKMIKNNLKQLIEGTSLETLITWMEWKKNPVSKRTEKVKEHGPLRELIAHICKLSPQFLKHSFIKRAQSETFNTRDRPRADSAEYFDEALLQIDFAENFICEAQDEVQNAHWNQRQLSLFTSALVYNGTIKSNVLVSNNLHHTKETIVPFLFKLLATIPTTIKALSIRSDGPSSQFKNRYIATIISHLETKFAIKIVWNYFATSHGKGCVDGIGANVKSIVRKHVKARDVIVNSASDFVEAFHRTPSVIEVEEVTEEEFDAINLNLNAVEIFSKAPNVRDIVSAHQLMVIDGKVNTFIISKYGYEQ